MNRKIDGTFFEFHHHNTPEGKYWNPALEKFEGTDWRQKVREISELGMEYIVIMATALYDKCYFKSDVFPFAETICADPIEEVLDEADKCGVKVFLGNGFYGDWRKAGQNIKDKEVIVNVISKSGNTLEPNIAFDIISYIMEGKYSKEELIDRIIITTDAKNGSLRKLAKEEGYFTFDIPKNIEYIL